MDATLITATSAIIVTLIGVAVAAIQMRPKDPMADRFKLFFNQLSADRAELRNEISELREHNETLRNNQEDWGVERQQAQRAQSELRVEIDGLREHNRKLTELVANLELHCMALEKICADHGHTYPALKPVLRAGR